MQINIQINECLPVCCRQNLICKYSPIFLASGQHFEIILRFLMIRLKSSLVSIMKLHYILPCGICCLRSGLYDFFNGKLLHFLQASHSFKIMDIFELD